MTQVSSPTSLASDFTSILGLIEKKIKSAHVHFQLIFSACGCGLTGAHWKPQLGELLMNKHHLTGQCGQNCIKLCVSNGSNQNCWLLFVVFLFYFYNDDNIRLKTTTHLRNVLFLTRKTPSEDASCLQQFRSKGSDSDSL